jgi:hypothetical protein
LVTRIIFCEEYRSQRSSLYSLIHFPVTSSHLGPDVSFSTLFSTTLSLFLLYCEGPSFTPVRTTGKISVPCSSIFIFLDSKRQEKTFCTEYGSSSFFRTLGICLPGYTQ